MATHYSKQAAAKQQQQEPAAKSLLRSAQNLADAVVELYLTLVIAPFLQLHETFYTGLNKFLRRILDNHHHVPTWFTANFITYARTLLVFPTILLLAAGGGSSFWQQILPAALVLAVDFGDFLDGVVARFWVDRRQQQQQAQKASQGEEESNQKENPSSSNTPSGSRSASPASSDKDSFGT